MEAIVDVFESLYPFTSRISLNVRLARITPLGLLASERKYSTCFEKLVSFRFVKDALKRFVNLIHQNLLLLLEVFRELVLTSS